MAKRGRSPISVDEIKTRFIAAVVPVGNNAVVDLSRVEFVASMGIRMLVSTARSLAAAGS